MLSYFKREKLFFISFLSIAIPIALQNLITAFVSTVDTVMIGQLGDIALSGVSLSNQIFNIYSFFIYGITAAASIYIAQFWGRKDVTKIHIVVMLCFAGSILFALIFFVGAFFFPGQLLGIYTKNPQIIEEGVKYLRLVSPSYLLFAISFPACTAMRSTEQALLPLLYSVSALLVNVLGNYILIFGKLVFPPLGVAGAAIATVIARLVEALLLLYAVFAKRNVIMPRFSEIFKITKAFVKDFVLSAIPVTLNESIWAIGMSGYMFIFARISTEMVAAQTINDNIVNMVCVFGIGMAHAAGIMIGKKLGEKEMDVAFVYAKRFTLFSLILGAFLGVCLLFAKDGILGFYNVSPKTKEIADAMLTVVGITMSVRFFNIVSVLGIIRSGGDVRFSLFLESACLWLVGIPLVALAGLVLKLEPLYIYMFLVVEEIIKCIAGFARVFSKKWIGSIT